MQDVTVAAGHHSLGNRQQEKKEQRLSFNLYPTPTLKLVIYVVVVSTTSSNVYLSSPNNDPPTM